MHRTYLSNTTNLPPHSHLTPGPEWLLPPPLCALSLAPTNPGGIKASDPLRSSGKSSNSGWLHSFLRTLIAFRGWESFPRNRALMSGELMNNRYSESWRSERPQNTTCSYLTGTEIGKTWDYRNKRFGVLTWENTYDICSTDHLYAWWWTWSRGCSSLEAFLDIFPCSCQWHRHLCPAWLHSQSSCESRCGNQGSWDWRNWEEKNTRRDRSKIGLRHIVEIPRKP